ncbi:MAG: hypothetical protein U0U09_09325 [Cyclobacteriaceae bacterium]
MNPLSTQSSGTSIPVAKAFISCSLREEDKPFIDLVEEILRKHNIEPFGTVGKYSASPENIAESMRKNIPEADLIVLIATPRYLQRDLKTGNETFGLSEMVHVETGMAFALEKPVVLFVKEGTNVGTFLPNITQYIILNGEQNDLVDKYALIYTLLNNAYLLVKKMKEKRSNIGLKHLVIGGLAIWGAYKIAEAIFKAFIKPKTKRKR